MASIKLVVIIYQARRVWGSSSLYETSVAVFTVAESWICLYLVILCAALGGNLNTTAYYLYAWPSSPICSFLRVVSFGGIHLTLTSFFIISVMRYFKIVHAVSRHDLQSPILIFPCLASLAGSLLISALLLLLQTVDGTLPDPVCLLFFSWPYGPFFWSFYSYFLSVNCLLILGVLVLGFRTATAISASEKIASSLSNSSIKHRRRVVCTRIVLQCSSGIMVAVATSIFQLVSGHFTDYNLHVWFVITVLPVSLLVNFCSHICFTPAFINDVRRTVKIITRNHTMHTSDVRF